MGDPSLVWKGQPEGANPFRSPLTDTERASPIFRAFIAGFSQTALAHAPSCRLDALDLKVIESHGFLSWKYHPVGSRARRSST